MRFEQMGELFDILPQLTQWDFPADFCKRYQLYMATLKYHTEKIHIKHTNFKNRHLFVYFHP